MKLDIENWKPVAGYEGRYEISDRGRVRSLLHQGVRIRRRPVILKPGLGRYGHQRVCLCKNGEIEQASVHCLVLEAFIGPCPKGLEGSHKDGCPSNNDVSNLLWETRRKNLARKLAHGTHNRGEKHVLVRLKLRQVKKIKAEYTGVRGQVADFARKYRVDISTIWALISGRTWRWV